MATFQKALDCGENLIQDNGERFAFQIVNIFKIEQMAAKDIDVQVRTI
jgi:hypothetical protein